MFLQGNAAGRLQRHITAVARTYNGFGLSGARAAEKSAAELICQRVIPRGAMRRLATRLNINALLGSSRSRERGVICRRREIFAVRRNGDSRSAQHAAQARAAWFQRN